MPSLSQVKALYKAKFGEDIDVEDLEEEQRQYTVEKDGITWMAVRGAPPSIAHLEDGLSQVKALYKAKFGEDIDAEDLEEEQRQYTVEKDGITWMAVRGAPPSIAHLEDGLSQVKALYKAKF